MTCNQSQSTTDEPTLIQYIDAIKSDPYIEIIHINSTTDADAWALLKTRQDKNWSLVDSASFVVMEERSITEVPTADRHFKQARFTRLLTS